jgi:outer membrane protein assembly factor BamB
MANNLMTEPAAATPASELPIPQRILRLWPAVAMLALFWLAIAAGWQLEMSPLARFLSRLALHGLLLIGFAGWWLSRRALSWRERLQAVLVFIAGSIALLLVADPSINGFTIFLGAMPIVFTAGTVALAATRTQQSSIRRTAVSAAILAVLFVFALLRSDGIDGWQHAEFNWRWRPTSEQLFLASHPKVTPAGNDADSTAAPAWTLAANDVPAFRGTLRNSVVTNTQLDTDWEAHAPKEIWRQRLGPAWSSVIVVDGRLVTQEQREGAEVVACYDAATGKELWVHSDAERFEESLSGAGPRGTPTFAEGQIFALGGKGKLNCLEAATGKPIWSHDLVAEANASVPQWGFSVSPLVVDGKVIVFAPGTKEKPSAGVVAYDAATGEKLWQTGDGGDSYSSPQLVELGGVKQVLMQDTNGLRAFGLDDGKLRWEHSTAGEVAMPMLQPFAVSDSRLLVALDSGFTLFDVKQENNEWQAEEVWVSNRIRPGFNDFLADGGKIFGLDDGILCALDLETGERLWKKGRYGHGQILLLPDQDLLLVQGARGEVILIDVSGEKPAELGKFTAIEGKTWNHPVLVGQRLFVRNGEEIACYELPAKN